MLSTNTGFFRVNDEVPDLPTVDVGDEWTDEEADEQAHRFLAALGHDRDIEQFDDPIETARENGLLLLFGAEEQRKFRPYQARMPKDRADAWADFLLGGTSSEAFGPLTFEEELDERQVEVALKEGRRQQLVNAGIGFAVLLSAVVVGVSIAVGFFGEDQRDNGALRFDDSSSQVDAVDLSGGAPSVVPELTTVLDKVVAVVTGEGPTEDRLSDPPASVLPVAPGALVAGLFEYAGHGQIVVVGPVGWVDQACMRVTVATDLLRALDVVSFGEPADCPNAIGRVPTVGCRGDNAVMIDLRIPSEAIALPEGGVGFADVVRVQLISDAPDYELISIRGEISVTSDADVVIPRFGGEKDDTLEFDFGEGRIGECVVTGDIPTA